MAHAVPRRQVIALAAATAGLWAAGCARAKRPRSVGCVPGVPLLVPLVDAAHAPGLEAALPGVQPVFQSQYKDLAVAGQAPEWWIANMSPFVAPHWYVPLDGAMRRANFNTRLLVPDALQAFQDAGTTYALPTSVTPIGVRYRPEAFAGAGLAPPSPDWTLDDFDRACGTILAAVQAGRLSQFYGPLPPLVGTSAYTATLPVYPTGELLQTSVPWTADLHDPDIWAAFAIGFGGALAKDGHFTLTDPATLSGLQRLVDIAREYGADVSHAPHSQEEAKAYPTGAAMQFAAYTQQTAQGGWQFARFPTLPVRAAVPARLAGQGLGFESSTADLWGGMPPPGSVPEAIALGTVRFCLWEYGRAQADPAAFDPSALADAAAQRAYWSAPPRGTDGGAAAADWRNYAFVQQGWPRTQTSPADLVFQALSDSVQGDGALADLLASAQARLNAEADRYAASRATEAGAPAPAIQADARTGASGACVR